ncbi:MAG: hypothetical protein PW734_01185 [Verrucomicrobium sp.]|nr:hypothetical protein [Verrucomicrobium sp.]
MQKNSLDHWIRSRFLFSYVIWCNSYPYLPYGAQLSQPPSDSKYRFAITFPNEQAYYSFTDRMMREQISYLPVIKRRDNFWVQWIEPAENGSLTSFWAWKTCQFFLLSALWLYMPLSRILDTFRAILLRA